MGRHGPQWARSWNRNIHNSIAQEQEGHIPKTNQNEALGWHGRYLNFLFESA
jgi:hypothetical protein